MCITCGCGTGEVKIEGEDAPHQHDHVHADGSRHSHSHNDIPAHSHAPGVSPKRMVQIEQDILAKNNAYAQQNRQALAEQGIFALNLVSSPGSGKTTLLCKTIALLGEQPVAVIEGDQQTSQDADRIRATGAQAIQINTGKGCHLDAHMVGHAMERLKLTDGSLLMIENVGNLVCPAAFDLGEAHKVVVLSVTEGEDKPIKYPDMFRAASVMLINKIDLLAHLQYDVATAIGFARRVNPQIRVIQLSATSGEGMDEWLAFLRAGVVGSVAARQARLAGIADAILDHDRTIVARCEDSVVRPLAAGFQFIRRSRGYAPTAIRLPRVGPSVLAFGAHLKNTICVTRGNEAFLSPHIGDLDNAATCYFLDETVQRMCALLDVKPDIVAHDLHPDDYSTRAAVLFAQKHDLPTLAVQHHHAHIAAVCAEHGRQGPVLGLALDGVGLGSDGTAWGGELLKVDGAHFERLGHLRLLALPGGDKAAREPWRMAASVLHELGRNADIGQRFQEPGANTVAAMLQRQFNSPRTSSMGRVFDAAAGLLGLCSHMKYEAQAAILLEQAATSFIEAHGWPTPMPAGWTITRDQQLDLLPLLASLDGVADVDQAAARFHATLVAGLTEWVMQATANTGLATLAWGGGCFLNTLLSFGLRKNLEQRGITVLAPTQTSPGDASIALGQAWVAMNSKFTSQQP